MVKVLTGPPAAAELVDAAAWLLPAALEAGAAEPLVLVDALGVLDPLGVLDAADLLELLDEHAERASIATVDKTATGAVARRLVIVFNLLPFYGCHVRCRVVLVSGSSDDARTSQLVVNAIRTPLRYVIERP
jgi:hypothetical protein